MKVNEQYSLVGIDFNNIALMEHKLITKEGSKNYGKEVVTAVAYFQNVEKALIYLVDREINGSGLEDIKTVVDKITELKDLIRAAGK